MKKTLLTLIILALAFTLADDAQARGRAACDGQGRMAGGCRNAQTCRNLPPAGDLSDAEAASLRAMRLEEKLARDVYLALGEAWDERAFTNIPGAENRHMSRVAMLLERYGLEDPVADAAVGEFLDADVQTLYDDFVARGKTSRSAALQVGAEIEDLDIHDLQRALDGPVDNDDIAMVYANLQRGSRNHLRAFAGRLAALGVEYETRHISAAELAGILASGHERGGRSNGAMAGRSRGRGRGPGRGPGQERTCGQGHNRAQGCRN